MIATLAAAGCSGTPGESPPPSSAATPTESPPAGPTGEPTEPAPSQSEQVAALWEDYHAAYLQQLGAEQIDPTAFEGLALDPDAVAAQMASERDALDNRLVTVEVEHWPQARIVSDGREAEVTDCVVASQYPASRGEEATATASSLWQASIVRVEDGWRVQSATAQGHLCIAEELNAELLDAYQQWTEARKQWFDPPDPDHALLEQLMAEPGLTAMREHLAELDAQDLVGRDERTDLSNAVVTELGVSTATITDCYPAELGGLDAYDRETGEERGDLNPETEPGSHSFVTVDLVRTGQGPWKATGWNFGRNSQCEPGDSDYDLA